MNTTSTHTTESQAPAAWWQAFDESEATVVNQYVWGARPGHRDELILRDRVTSPATSETSSEPPEPDERLWSLMDYYDPTSAVNTEGEVVERYRFSAFGLRTVLAPDFSPRAVSPYDWDFAFKGQFLDVDTGYYNYGYRYYSPELGRWLSRDPIGEEGGNNLYGMVENNAVGTIDKLGLAAPLVLPAAAISAAAYAMGISVLACMVYPPCLAEAGRIAIAMAAAAAGEAYCLAMWAACNAACNRRPNQRSCFDCFHSCRNDGFVWPNDCL